MITSDLSDYKYRPMPEPPAAVIQYAKKKLDDPGLEIKEGYWREKYDVMKWFKEIGIWQANTLSNFDWLTHLKESAETDNERLQITTLLKEFNENVWWAFGTSFLKEIVSYSTLPVRREAIYA